MHKVDMKPGSVIVFEGLDSTGKSTILRRLRNVAPDLFEDYEDIMFTHQPSGGSAVGNAVYSVTENGPIVSPWARQFLHLASHAEHYAGDIIPHVLSGGVVFMDRFWWSTVAYGYFSGGLSKFIEYEDYEKICRIPTQGLEPAVVFLFMNPWMDDSHNTTELEAGYHFLAERYSGLVQFVEPNKPDVMATNIMLKLGELDIARKPVQQNVKEN